MATEKSMATGIILAILLGPLGLIYASTVWGVILTVLALASMPTIVGPIFFWLLSPLVAAASIAKHNSSAREFMAALRDR